MNMSGKDNHIEEVHAVACGDSLCGLRQMEKTCSLCHKIIKHHNVYRQGGKYICDDCLIQIGTDYLEKEKAWREIGNKPNGDGNL
jgi:hypothetical protein